MFCPQCGSAIPDGGRFCGECGAAAGAAPAPPQRPPAPPPPVWSAPPPPAQPPSYFPPPPPAAPPGYGQLPPPPMQSPPGYGLPPQPAPAMYPPPATAGSPLPPAAAAPIAGSPVPPRMHWAVLLILTWFTGGLAGLIWCFKQAFFVKKLDPSSKGVMLLVLSLAGMVTQVVVVLMSMGAWTMSETAAITGIVLLLNLLIFVVWLMAVFGMRRSIVQYYNTREPIGLKLSGVMTFFFSILYFQYHFSRIAEWKQTGRLG